MILATDSPGALSEAPLPLQVAGRERSSSFPPVDTKNAAAVAAFVEEKFIALFPSATPVFIDRVFHDVVTLFSGGHPDYAAVDIGYHDLEHTLQATVCLVLLLEGRELARAEPRLDARDFELAIAGILLHDSGYLKLRSDTKGTGAKYTFCHVLRSCAFAATYLPTLSVNEDEIKTVLAAINCTGPTNEISRLDFRVPVERTMAAALATADYLGQMAAADYPDELEILYHEFEESDDFLKVPAARRMFKSPADLIARTPGFWNKFVRSKLETDFQALYRFLASPFPDGANPYLAAVEANISEIERRSANRLSA